MENYKEELRDIRKQQVNKVVKNPLFSFVILVVVLAFFQILYMTTDGLISLTLSKALAQTLIYTIVAMGFSLLLGYGGLASLGTAGFIGVGTYVAGNMLKMANMPFIVILLVVVVVAVIMGSVVGFISLRIEGMYLAIITLGLSEILLEMFKTPNPFTNGTSGIRGVPFPTLFNCIQLDRETTFFLILAVLFIMIVITINLINSPTGRALLAMKNSESAAQAMGISLLKYRLLAFILATVYAMIGGALYVSYVRASDPTSWTLSLSLNILAAVIIGGSQSVWGILLGSFVIFGLDLAILKNIAFFNQYPGSSMIFSGVLIILIIMFYPGGLIKLFNDIKVKLLSLKNSKVGEKNA